MAEKDARFYFANFAADVVRCAVAAMSKNEERYESSFSRARSTLRRLRRTERPEAYEEALLLMLALKYAKEDNNVLKFNTDISRLIRFTGL